MKTMATHSSATAREHTPHLIDSQNLNAETSSNDEKLEALAEIICSAGEESSAALLVLMATLENSMQPKELAHTTKHIAFTRCGELNSFGIVDDQVALVQEKLLARNTSQ
jgi:hypothetical protein